jgi:protein gp37
MKRFEANPTFTDEARAKYAASFDRKLGPVSLWPERIPQPLHWCKPQTVFVVSQGDLFHDDVPFEFIGRIFGTMHHCKKHTFLVLTKRPKRMSEFLDWYRKNWLGKGFEKAYPAEYAHVWLGVSVEDQKTADERIPILLSLPAAKRFVSIEPMLGSIILTGKTERHGRSYHHYNWLTGNYGVDTDPESSRGQLVIEERASLEAVILGGESGPSARPMHPDWARKVRDDCKAAGVPFMFKQWGEWAPHRVYADLPPSKAGQLVEMITQYSSDRKLVGKISYWAYPDKCNGSYDHLDRMERVGKKKAGRLLDGVLHNGRPGK